MTIKPTSDAVAVTEADADLQIGQVQWHSSEEDGGPDVGILLRLDADHHLWWGELLAGEGDGFGAVIYGPGNERKVFETAYDELRQVFEDYVAPALRHRLASTRPMTEDVAGLVEETARLQAAKERVQRCRDELTFAIEQMVDVHVVLTALKGNPSDDK